jgi:hypothetical protein
MKKPIAAFVGAFLALAMGIALAQPQPPRGPQPPPRVQTHACSLLTGAEVGSALGAQPAPSQENNVVIPDGPSRGQTIAMCAWRLGPRDIVRVSVAPALDGAQRAQGLSALTQSFDQMKADGWRENARQFGDIRCSSMTPPPDISDAPLMTGCMGEARGRALSISAMSASKPAAIDPIKDLFDKAAARLP